MSGKYQSLIDTDDNENPFADNQKSNKNDINDMTSQAYILPDDEELFPQSTSANPPAYESSPLDNSRGQSQTVALETGGSVFSLSYYRKYFDLTSDDFLMKMIGMLTFQKYDELNSGLEMYGYVWINATVIFTLFVIGSTCNSLLNYMKGDNWAYEFSTLIFEIIFIYVYNLVTPFLIFISFIQFYKLNEGFSLVKLVSIYSYSSIFWIPVVLVNILRVFVMNSHLWRAVFRWTLAAVGGGISGFSIMFQIGFIINTQIDDKKRLGFNIGILTIHAVFSLVMGYLLKFYMD